MYCHCYHPNRKSSAFIVRRSHINWWMKTQILFQKCHLPSTSDVSLTQTGLAGKLEKCLVHIFDGDQRWFKRGIKTNWWRQSSQPEIGRTSHSDWNIHPCRCLLPNLYWIYDKWRWRLWKHISSIMFLSTTQHLCRVNAEDFLPVIRTEETIWMNSRSFILFCQKPFLRLADNWWEKNNVLHHMILHIRFSLSVTV